MLRTLVPLSTASSPASHSDDVSVTCLYFRFQKGMNRREKAIHGKSRISHSVHCPYYTDDKQEFWWVFERLPVDGAYCINFGRWVYISDRKTHSLITPPYHLTSLVTEEEVELKFTAPNKEGVYNFTVCVRSDSYLGVDLLEDIKLDVQKAWEAPKEHKQWDFTVRIFKITTFYWHCVIVLCNSFTFSG